MDHIIRRTRNSGDTIEVMERINTVARIVLDSESHVNNVKILGESDIPSPIGSGIDTLDHRLAILTAEDKAGRVDFKLGHGGHISLPDRRSDLNRRQIHVEVCVLTVGGHIVWIV
jgi:hypothetical protein